MNFRLLPTGKLENTLLCLILTSSTISSTHGSVDVTYLVGTPRLNDTSFWDYYFHCHATGKMLRWQVNGSVLGAFDKFPHDIISGGDSSMNYTATLLSLHRTQNGDSEFDSVLIVSVRKRSKLYILCMNEQHCDRAVNKNNGGRDVVERSSTNASILLEYLYTPHINIGLQNDLLSMFVCGANNIYIEWHVYNDTLSFDQHDDISDSRHILRGNSTAVKWQGILIGHEPYSVVSVVFVLDSSNVTVVCENLQQRVQLTSKSINQLTTSEKPTLLTTLSTSEKTTSGDATVLGITSNCSSQRNASLPVQLIAGIVVPTAISSFIIGIVITAIICTVFHSKKAAKRKYALKNEESEGDISMNNTKRSVGSSEEICQSNSSHCKSRPITIKAPDEENRRGSKIFDRLNISNSHSSSPTKLSPNSNFLMRCSSIGAKKESDESKESKHSLLQSSPHGNGDQEEVETL